jgi:6-phosphogluconolactonase/glucosamine-6-phosphate isomerase/deaminase
MKIPTHLQMTVTSDATMHIETLLDPPALAGVTFLVAGREKAAILKTIRAGGSQVPAARVKPVGELIWFTDRAAAGEA